MAKRKKPHTLKRVSGAKTRKPKKAPVKPKKPSPPKRKPSPPKRKATKLKRGKPVKRKPVKASPARKPKRGKTRREKSAFFDAVNLELKTQKKQKAIPKVWEPSRGKDGKYQKAGSFRKKRKTADYLLEAIDAGILPKPELTSQRKVGFREKDKTNFKSEYHFRNIDGAHYTDALLEILHKFEWQRSDIRAQVVISNTSRPGADVGTPRLPVAAARHRFLFELHRHYLLEKLELDDEYESIEDIEDEPRLLFTVRVWSKFKIKTQVV